MSRRPYPKRDLAALILAELHQPRTIGELKMQFPEDATRIAYTVYNAVKRGELRNLQEGGPRGTSGLFVRADAPPAKPADTSEAAEVPDDFERPVVKRTVPATEAEPLPQLGPRSVFDLAPAPTFEEAA